MKNKIINGLLAVFLGGLLIVTFFTYNIEDTIDALTGATPTNEVYDAISGATTSSTSGGGGNNYNTDDEGDAD